MTLPVCVTVIGARPQFIKAGPVSRALRAESESGQPVAREVLVHTGQHYDDAMSAVFFRELDVPLPDHELGVGSGSHAEQTAAMLTGLERLLLAVRPDFVLVYGDTNSTLAGALAAAKLAIPTVHIEAGLRSGRWDMPEEINRVVADRLAHLRFCPSAGAARNLRAEGLVDGVFVVGDVMLDAQRSAMQHAPPMLPKLPEGRFAVGTIHRAENTDDPHRLRSIIEGLDRVHAQTMPVVAPLHPRTTKRLDELGIVPSFSCLEPQGYRIMLELERRASVVLTDSGGVQKEAYWLGVPCVTMRDETEWPETVAAGWNVLSGVDPDRIAAAVCDPRHSQARPDLYGDGHAAERIVTELLRWLPRARAT